MRSVALIGFACLLLSSAASCSRQVSDKRNHLDAQIEDLKHCKLQSSLVDIESVIPGVMLELRYATDDNFTGQVVFDFYKCLLVEDAALRLQAAQEEFKTMGLEIKIWDGYRPMAAQWKFWELVPDERYVSDPRKGGRHTRGTAIDLTLIDNTGCELSMPSEFDDFSEKAHRDYAGASFDEIQNRELLQTVMERHGFCGLPTEWWHFDLIGWENYLPQDIDPNTFE